MESAKETLRRAMRARRAALDDAASASAGARIAALLRPLAIVRKAKVLVAYLARGNEVSTDAVIAEAAQRGQAVFVPETQRNWFIRYDVDSPSNGPMEASEAWLAAEERSGLILVPLLAWTPQGDRLGRGGGWYDRVLPRLRIPTIGVAYEFQRREHVPTEPTDVRLDYVVTEDRLIECGRVPSGRRLFVEGGK